jgi:hypothetical protein
VAGSKTIDEEVFVFNDGAHALSESLQSKRGVLGIGVNTFFDALQQAEQR